MRLGALLLRANPKTQYEPTDFSFSGEIRRFGSFYDLMQTPGVEEKDIRIFYREFDDDVKVMDIYRMNRFEWPLLEGSAFMQRIFGWDWQYSEMLADFLMDFRYLFVNIKNRQFIFEPALLNLMDQSDWVSNDFHQGN